MFTMHEALNQNKCKYESGIKFNNPKSVLRNDRGRKISIPKSDMN